LQELLPQFEVRYRKLLNGETALAMR
jgi:hypothetical protein